MNMRGFILVVACITKVLAQEHLVLSPGLEHTVITPGGSTAFTCYASMGDLTNASWLFNNSRMEGLDLTGIEVHLEYYSFGEELTLRNISERWNNTAIKCEGIFSSGNVLTTGQSVLQLQGVLDAVGSLNLTHLVDNSFLISWTAPHSLQFSIIGPQMTFCVQVVNTYQHSAVLSPELILSECEVNITQFVFALMFPLSLCDLLEARVTPVNRAGNGTSATVEGDFFSVEQIMNVGAPPSISSEDVRSAAEGGQFEFQINISTMIVLCSAHLQYTSSHLSYQFDESNGLQCTRNSADHTSLILRTSALPHNRLFNSAFTITNCVGSTRSELTLSTYDVQRITFMSCLDETNGCVRIRTSFSTGSPAQGALLILLPQSRTEQSTPSQQEGYYLFIRQGLRDLIELREMVAGMYDVYLYDVEENGFVDSGPPAVRKAVSVSNTHGIHHRQTPSTNSASCRVTKHNTSITITCDSSLTSGGYLGILQDTSNMAEIITGHIVSETAGLSFRSLHTGKYQVTVLPFLGDCSLQSSADVADASCVMYTEEIEINFTETVVTTGSEPSFVPATMKSWVNIVYSVTFFTIGILVGLVFFILACICHKKCKKVRSHEGSGLYIKPGKTLECPVYEDIGPQVVNKMHFELEQNDAYGHVK